MSPRARARRRGLVHAVAALVLTALVPGCVGSSRYAASAVARGELIVTSRRGLTLSMGGREVARAPVFRDLPRVVRCVPEAHEHAVAARSAGRRARLFSALGATLGLGAMMAFAAIPDRDHAVQWLVGGFGSGLLGLAPAIASRRAKKLSIGHALDATNFYDDRVGSLGASCDDLTYPAPLVLPPNAQPLQ